MNYVGKFLSNFKGFYNDINSATLTGAIDILVVRLEDGSFATSPWHVRFGKMGVIRAREKLVDIEINGEPVKLYMKLGEAGEAYFVQKGENDQQTDYHEGHQLDIEDASEDFNASSCIHIQTDADNEFAEELVNKQFDTVIRIEGDNVIVTEVPKVMETTDETESVTMDNNHYFASHSSLTSSTSSEHKSGKSTKATQTEMSGNDVEAKQCKSRNVSGESRSQSPFPALLPLTVRSEPVGEVTNVKTLQAQNLDTCQEESNLPPREEGSSTVEKVDADVDATAGKLEQSLQIDEMVVNAPEPVVDHLNPVAVGDCTVPSQLEVFEMELSDDEVLEKQKIGVGNLKKLSVDLCDDLEQDWAPNPFACNFHPFSDTDITPATSPIASRPPSPKSDTEYETKKFDATSQTQLTGDELMLLDDIKWEWGEFPQMSPLPAAKPTMSESFSAKEEKSSGGLFQFMRKTKKMRHQPKEEGIYLDDLDLASMDPEVAALYLYDTKSSGKLSASQSKDEDSESGQGLSLPQSPVTFDQENLTVPLATSSDNSHINSPVTVLSDVSLSLCGSLEDVERGVALERFNRYLVTYDSFCDNPNLLMDPNLVVRLSDRFYSWPVAGTLIMSQLLFKKSLGEEAVESLVKQHMPKKERKRGLWWWSRGAQGTTSAAADPSPNPQAIVSTASDKDQPPDTQVKIKPKPRKMREREGSTSGEESDTACNIEAKMSSSGRNLLREKFTRSLKLTSEQIASLNLRDGANEIAFSVTTQYQGTSRCNCYLYLWNWDDRIIISDIDGTITRSDVWGQVLPMIGKDWSQAGIANLYQMINRNGYKFLYLSARAIGQSKITRDYLHSVRQGDLCLPDGPLLLSPSSLLSAFYKEVIERKPEEFKIGCLRDISALFPPSRTPFYAGFGNKINDSFAYRAVGIPISRIFTVNPKGELSMGMSFQSSYTKLSDIVDHFFPPLLHCNCHHEVVEAGKFPGATEYSDFTYWREPLPDIQDDLTLIASVKMEKSTSRKETGREKLRQSKKGRKK